MLEDNILRAREYNQSRRGLGSPPLRENSNQKFERQRNGQERASLILSGGRSSSGRSTGMGGGNFSRHWHPGLRQAWKWVGHKGSERRCPGDSIGAWSWTGGPGELPAPPKSSYTAVRSGAKKVPPICYPLETFLWPPQNKLTSTQRGREPIPTLSGPLPWGSTKSHSRQEAPATEGPGSRERGSGFPPEISV